MGSLIFFLGASKILHLCPKLETLEIGADLLTLDLLYPDEGTEILPVALVHPLRHLYIASPARSGAFLEEELLDTRDIASAVGDDALPKLRLVTLEVFFTAPKEWKAADLLLHRRLKQRAEDNGEDVKDAGIRFAVLQG